MIEFEVLICLYIDSLDVTIVDSFCVFDSVNGVAFAILDDAAAVVVAVYHLLCVLLKLCHLRLNLLHLNPQSNYICV